MSVTVRGTDILFNDGTTQSTANNLPANTTNVLNATASASVGAVGTYAFLARVSNSGNTTGNALSPGGTVAGSVMRYGGTSPYSGVAPAGTWRCMGSMAANYSGTYQDVTSYSTTLFLRIS